MTAFDRAFALLKMPYHGTNEESAKRIMRGGTRAFRDKRNTFRNMPAKFWMTDTVEEAMRHARKAGRQSKTDDDYRETGFSRPTVLHISDEGVDSVPHDSSNYLGDTKFITHGHPHRIDPKHISIHSQGPKPDIPDLFDWSQDEVDRDEGREAEAQRQQAIDDYRRSVSAWGRDWDD
jgi:hypothetical protein|tara:strand:+ start:4796 stop:5326 length:531 start_codon:yes stop_codon:yes gene_type:complete